MTLVTWVGLGILVLLNIVGWFISYNRYSRNEARHLGRLEGKVDGLNKRMEGVEKRIESLGKRIDDFITSHS